MGPSTAATPGLLVPSVRAMIDEEYTNKTTDNSDRVPKLELEHLTAGAIADLCNVSRDSCNIHIDGGDYGVSRDKQEEAEEANQYYAPLQPFSLSVSSRPPHIELGRVDMKLHALHRKLCKIS